MAKSTLKVGSPTVDALVEGSLLKVAVGKGAVPLSLHDFMLFY